MTHNQHADAVQNDGPYTLPVRFEFTDANAGSVYIAGTFNNWQPDAKPMHALGNNRWARELTLPIGIHEYCFVVDGEFRVDPMARESVPNPFGGRNSLLKLINESPPIRFATATELQNEWRIKYADANTENGK